VVDVPGSFLWTIGSAFGVAIFGWGVWVTKRLMRLDAAAAFVKGYEETLRLYQQGQGAERKKKAPKSRQDIDQERRNRGTRPW